MPGRLNEKESGRGNREMADMEQRILSAGNDFEELEGYLRQADIRKPLLVCGKSVEKLQIYTCLLTWQREGRLTITRFSDFQPNPTYDSVERGVALFRQENCDAIMAVGGGSAIDVAKCIKLYANMQDDRPYLEQEIAANRIPLLVMPTTAGTGSEATRFAVIYYQGEKQSVTHESCIPGAVLFDSSVLYWLPDYHKKAAMLDALCHAVESMWSVNATAESKKYARQAIGEILRYGELYLRNEDEAGQHMLMAANIAGKAINITQTTAGHAMCYKLTGLYGIAHGHAAALCVRSVWAYMLQNNAMDVTAGQALCEIAEAMGCREPTEAWKRFSDLLDAMDFEKILPPDEKEMALLCRSVNPVRLKNHPIALKEEAIRQIYEDIFRGK